MASKVLYTIYLIYCFEVGVFLLFFPWMDFWRDNMLLIYLPTLKTIFLNNFFRGAVSGLGVANILLGVWEVLHYRRYFKKS